MAARSKPVTETRMFKRLLNTHRFIAHHPLTKRKKFPAIRRFLKWQVVSRLAPGRLEVPFVEHTKLLVGRGMTGATGNYYTGLHEFRDMAFLLHLLRSGDDFIDVGANVGSYTVLASGVVGARTLCFEPAPQTFSSLTDNIVLNGLSSRVQAVQAAVGAVEGEVRFTTDRDTMNHIERPSEKDIKTAADGRPASIRVPLHPLDRWAHDVRPVLLKVDVEGFEADVLAGAAAILQSLGLLAILIENNEGVAAMTSPGSVHNRLLDAGFSPANYDPFSRSLTTSSSKDVGDSCNGLYVRDRGTAGERLRSSRPFRVLGQTI
jgi:FkbM family methyltransferase